MTDENTTNEADAPDPRDAQAAFDAERQSGVTSTDVASILGLSRWGTALSVYKAKRGESLARPPSLAAWIGLRLENMVSELYTTATGTRVRADNLYHTHPEYPWFGCHLDRRAVGDPRHLIELKTRFSSRGWGPDGSVEIPVDVWCQVQAQMSITGATRCDVAALFGNSDFRVYPIVPDETFTTELIPTLRDFWFDNVLAGIPPAPTGSDADSDIVKAMGGGDSGVMKPATAEQELLVDRLRDARMALAKAENAKAEAENLIKVIIGEDADGLTGSFGTITWKRSKPWVKYDWKTLAGVYHLAALRLLDLAPADQPDMDVADETESIRTTVMLAADLYGETQPAVRRMDLHGLREE